MLLLALLVPLAASSSLPSSSVSRDPRTTLVFFGTRHGNRNPEHFIEDQPRVFGFEGELELTEIGKRQSYGLGQEMRKFVDGLVSPNYLPAEAKFYSSSANRCQMTLQVALAGLYVPDKWADWNTQLDWSPVPYSIDDALLRMYNVSPCPNSDSAWQPITDDTLPDLVALAQKDKALLDYMKANTGEDASISNAADIADNIVLMDFYNTTYPTWLSHPNLTGYDAASIKKAFLSYAEKHMIDCSNYGPCKKMMGGVWIQNLLTNLDSAVNGKAPKVIGYASHTEVTLSTMHLLGIDKNELTTSAGFVLEYRPTPTPSVRLLNHDPNPIDQHVIYKAKLVPELERSADGDGFIPLNAFKQYVQPVAISDWQSACGISSCSTSTTKPCTHTNMFPDAMCEKLGHRGYCVFESMRWSCEKECFCKENVTSTAF